MTQTTIFDLPADTHAANLCRVKRAISATIRAFLAERGTGSTFSMVELTEYVRARH